MRLLIATLLYLALASPVFAQADNPLVSIRSGETLAIKSISWLSAGACTVLFQKIDSVDVMEPIEGITLKSSEPSRFFQSWKGCPEGLTVEGVHIMMTAAQVSQKIEGNLTYRVSMETTGGPAQVTYRIHVIIYPTATH